MLLRRHRVIGKGGLLINFNRLPVGMHGNWVEVSPAESKRASTMSDTGRRRQDRRPTSWVLLEEREDEGSEVCTTRDDVDRGADEWSLRRGTWGWCEAEWTETRRRRRDGANWTINQQAVWGPGRDTYVGRVPFCLLACDSQWRCLWIRPTWSLLLMH